jgi:ABC-type multidrug transport system fused ATPase/permease subunit
MPSSFFSTLGPAVTLIRRVNVSRPGLALAIVLLFVGGALEGVTVGLLVPLLTMLTGSAPANGYLNDAVEAVLGGISAGGRVALLGLAVLAVVALKNALSFAGVAVAGKLRAEAGIELRRQLLDRVLHAAPATLEHHTSGEITKVIVNDVWRVARVLELCVAIVHRFVIVLSYLVAMTMLSWQLTLVTVVLGLGLGVVSQQTARRGLRFGRSLTRANGLLARHVTEIVGGLRIIRTTSSEPEWERSFAKISRDYAHSELGAQNSQAMMSGIVETAGIAGAMGLTALAHVFFLVPGTLDVPTFLAFGFGLIRLMPALNQVYTAQAFLVPLVGSIEVLLDWLDLPNYPTRPFGQAQVAKLEQGIRFENVSFAYPKRAPVISDLSFFLPVGETLAILGTSGTGKSTLVSLLLRLREPTSGRILIDGVDHWEFAPSSFHRAVVYVDQEAFMFNATIAENVSAGVPGIGRDAILDALRKVRLDETIAALPLGIDTVVAERGSTLSGGQRQRLAIARAIVRNPQVLVLDEPTSALDPETEQEVVSAIDAASIGRTTIIITHRATTARHATRRLNLQPESRPVSLEKNGAGIASVSSD